MLPLVPWLLAGAAVTYVVVKRPSSPQAALDMARADVAAAGARVALWGDAWWGGAHATASIAVGEPHPDGIDDEPARKPCCAKCAGASR